MCGASLLFRFEATICCVSLELSVRAVLELVLKHDMHICATDPQLNIGEGSHFKQLPVVETERNIQMIIPEYCGRS